MVITQAGARVGPQKSGNPTRLGSMVGFLADEVKARAATLVATVPHPARGHAREGCELTGVTSGWAD